MMTQYFALKREAGDCLLFYRMGDFIEMFFDDAKIAAQVLDIALTSRGDHEGRPVPMCGVPVHAADAYLARLIKGGHRVAIAEQIESPAAAKAASAATTARRARRERPKRFQVIRRSVMRAPRAAPCSGHSPTGIVAGIAGSGPPSPG